MYEIIKSNILTVLLFVIILSTSIGLYFLSENNKLLFDNKLYDSLILLLPLTLILMYSKDVLPDYSQMNSLKILPYILFLITLATSIWYLFYYNSIFSFYTGSVTLLLTFIIILGLSIIFYFFGNYIKSMDGFFGNAVRFLFNIPAIVNEIIDYIVSEYRITTKPILFTFILEIVLILIYITLPWLMKKILHKNSVYLLEDTIFLDNPQNIPIHEHAVFLRDENDKDIYRRNYAISMWFYLNKFPTNYISYANESIIFDYGNGKPKLTYVYDENDEFKKDKFIFCFSNHSDEKYEITLPAQKWNHVVFNYYSSHADLFINGNLERSFKFEPKEMPTYSSQDTIQIGDEGNLSGAISKVQYFKNSLNTDTIANLYNLTMDKNPPL